jgi:hypothetical protein
MLYTSFCRTPPPDPHRGGKADKHFLLWQLAYNGSSSRQPQARLRCRPAGHGHEWYMGRQRRFADGEQMGETDDQTLGAPRPDPAVRVPAVFGPAWRLPIAVIVSWCACTSVPGDDQPEARCWDGFHRIVSAIRDFAYPERRQGLPFDPRLCMHLHMIARYSSTRWQLQSKDIVHSRRAFHPWRSKLLGPS